ncbi:MAG: MotA/TolQ/ExbB proton channel family protein [Myxococcales bacterium]|nr:MotA/TolQ/ExbB proton channel family protein [Myxococcales bacterium]
MSFNLADVFKHMQPFAMAIVAVLLLMAMAALSVFVERIWVFFKSRRMAKRFGAAAAGALDRRDLAGLIKLSDQYDGCHLATMLTAGTRTYLGALAKPGELDPVELTRRELTRQADAVSADVRRGMSILASVGSVAPFVGLLGTVIGIIGAFQGIAAEGSGGLGAVSAGISEALVVTAIGLVVAIPSVLAFNSLSSRADNLLLALDQSRGEFIDYLENQGSADVGGGLRAPRTDDAHRPLTVEARASASA